MKIYKSVILTFMATSSFAFMQAMEEKEPRTRVVSPPCSLTAVARPEDLRSMSASDRRKLNRQLILQTFRSVAATTTKSLQQTSAKVIINQLLHTNENEKAEILQANSPVINKILFDQIEHEKDVLDPLDPIDLDKIEKLDDLELVIIDVLGKQVPSWYAKKEESTEKEEKMD